MKKLFLLFIAVIAFQSSYASHATGGEIWYEHDTLNTYTIHFRLYNACQGPPAPATINLNYKSVSLAVVPQTLMLNQTSTYVNNTCIINNCMNPASAYPGINVAEYSGTVSLSGAANDWYFYVYWISRLNSTNMGSGNLYVDATLDNLNTPFNNSVAAYSAIDMIQFFNSQTTVHLPMYDADGDSIDVNFVNPLTGSSTGLPTNINILTPYTYLNPFNSTPAPLLNPSTGNLTLYPALVGGYTFAIKIDEYRGGVLIGSTVRDYAVNYNSNSSNSSPALSGVNNTTNYTTTIDVCPTSSLTFTVNSSDPDISDSTFIDALNIPTGSNFTANTAQNQIGVFTWTPTAADVRPQPYIISFKVRDNNCAEQSYGYQVFVTNCNPDSVWAGDANADFTCDNYDVLNIGIANGSTGVTRPGATTTWQAEWCANWANSFINNINHKHADCNGDGVVDNVDLASITANYGQVHFKNSNIGQYKTLGLPDLRCDVSSVQAHRGSTISIPIMLGSSSSLMNDFYGISATVELLNAKTSAPIGVSKNVSWIGNTSNSFEFEKSIAPNKTAFTFVRNDHQNLITQQGQIGELSFPIDMTSVIGSKVIIQFSNIKMIKANGAEITDYNVLQDSLTILAPTALNEFEQQNTINIYPNPVKSKTTISIKTDRAQDYKMVLYDVVGRLVDATVYAGSLHAGEHTIELDLSDKAQGEYLLEIQTELGKKVIPIQKW